MGVVVVRLARMLTGRQNKVVSCHPRRLCTLALPRVDARINV